MTHCEISSTPAYQFLLTDLIPFLGDRADHEAFRDYLEFGRLREADQILRKLRKEPFSNTTVLSSGANNELLMTNKAKFRALGVSVPKKQISNQQVMNLKKLISTKNNDLSKAGIDQVYKLETAQVGESDNFTWEVKVFRGKLDRTAKASRASDFVLDAGRLPNVAQQAALDLNTVMYDNTTPDDTVNNYAQELVRKYAEVLSEQTGVPTFFVSAQEAKAITENSDNPWNGQTGFFYGGRVYFIAGSLKPSTVFHEFSHPVIRGINLMNRPLFNSLYDRLLLTDEGKHVMEEVRDLYPNLTENADDFKEEVLVRAMEKKADLDNKGIEQTSAFNKFIQDLLYAVRQMLRKAFGQKIKVSDMNVNTTLDELVKMLEHGTSFDLDPMVITDRDMVAYKNEFNQYMKGFVAENADVKQLENAVNDYYHKISQYIKSVRGKENLGELAEILSNRFNTGELDLIKKNLKGYQTKIIEHAIEIEDEVELTSRRVKAMINSMGNMDNTVKKILDGLNEFDINNPDDVGRMLYYQKMLKDFKDFTNEAETALTSNGVQRLKIVDSINANVRRAEELIENFYEQASKDFLTKFLSDQAAAIDKKWQEIISSMKGKGATAEQITEAEAQYKAERITPEKIEDALKGRLKDVSFLGAYMEGYSFSPDPVVGGLANFIKQHLTRAEAAVQANVNDAAKDLVPLLKKAGFTNMYNSHEIGQKLGQKILRGRVNEETGELEEREVWQYLDKFSGHQIVRDRYRYNIVKVAEKYRETGSDEDKQALANLQEEWRMHNRQYYHGEFTEDFHKIYDIMGHDDIGNEARMDRDELYSQLNDLQGSMVTATSDEVLEVLDEIEGVRREIKQLSSLYDQAGRIKTGRDLEKALRLNEFNEAARDLYEDHEIPDAFEQAYRAYEQRLLDEGKKKGDGRYEDLLEKWVERNSVIRLSDEFWDKMNALIEEREAILSKIPNDEFTQVEIKKYWEELRNLIRGNRDESGQPMGNEMTEDKQARIKELQELIADAQQRLMQMSGLTRAENQWIDQLFAKVGQGYKMTKEESLRLSNLYDKKNRLKLGRLEQARLRRINEEMNELRSKEPTDDYIDQVNNLLAGMDSEVVHDILGKVQIDKSDAQLLSNDETVKYLMAQSEEFKTWFERNHLRREDLDYETGNEVITWSRTYAWNVIKPNDQYYYESMSFANLEGEDITLLRIPSMKYHSRTVKDEYRTEKTNDTIDNRGEWLPKTIEQGAPDDRYENKDYYRMQKEQPAMFDLLEKMKDYHLKFQEGLQTNRRLGLEFARYRKGARERAADQNPITSFFRRFIDFFRKIRDSWEQDMNFNEDTQLTALDMFHPETNGIPISGTSDLDIDEVSTDVMRTMFTYMASAERNKALTKAAPMARMVQKVVNNEKNIPLEKRMLANNNFMFMPTKKNRYVRARAVNNYIEQELEGKNNTGLGADSVFAHTASKAIFKLASGSFLNLNIPSAVKNWLGMKFQGSIEASAGQHFTWKEWLAAEKDATAVSMEVSQQIRERGPKSLNVQILEIFDPERDRLMNHAGESLTRSKRKDYLFNPFQRMTDFRRWLQVQASAQALYAMMNHTKIKRDGKMINYRDAWELRDGKIQLKSGIDPEWGITYDEAGNQLVGDKFITYRNKFNRVQDYMNGAMSKEDSPEVNRYLLGRFLMFFRRFMVSMISNRFAYSGQVHASFRPFKDVRGRFDHVLQDTKMGYYIQFLRLMHETAFNLGKNLKYMTPDEKRASIKVLADTGFFFILKYLVLSAMFGFDPDDPDKIKKLRARSGALPFFFVDEKDSRNFNLAGWLENHAILMSLQVSSENSAFLPVPGMGLSQWKDLTEIKSLAMAPTLRTSADMVNDLYNIATGSDKAVYKRDSGPYVFQREGSYKIFQHFLSAAGFKGSHVDPALGVKNFVAIEGR